MYFHIIRGLIHCSSELLYTIFYTFSITSRQFCNTLKLHLKALSGVSYGLHIRVPGSKNEKVGLLLVLGFGAIRLRYGRFRSVLKLTKTNNMNKQRQRVLPAVVCSQLVEKVQHRLGFLLYLWYNRYGDENVGKERK